jgi:hypothetical protein
MVALIFLALNLVVAVVKSKSRLEAENAALRQQLIVLRRQVQERPPLTSSDRLFFVQLYRWFPSILKVITIVSPGTLVRLHRAGFSTLLALEVSLTGGPPSDRYGAAGVDPPHEHGESPLGCATHSRRTAQTRICGRPVDRRQVHGEDE